MAVLNLLDLSYDLKSLIISYVTRPTDMKNLCLSCKALRDVAVRQLYRQVELDIGCEADLKLSAFLGRSNPGLEHVRTLLLNPQSDDFPLPSPATRPPSPPQAPPAPIPTLQGFGPPPPLAPLPPPPIVQDQTRNRVAEERKKRWSPAHFTVRLLIELLPEHILEKFRWSSYDEFSADNFVLLCKKQKNLKCIEVGVMKGSLTEALHAHPDLIKNLEQLHALDLYPETVDCLEACHKVIQSTPKLDQLLIESAATTINADGQWDDESNKPGLITSTLFKDKLPFQSCTPMSLKFLSLNRINLRWAAQTYMKVIQFPNLEELEIRCCLGADALFAEMSKPAKRPDKLECLTYVQAADGRTLQYIQSSLENFLQSISTLKKLYVNFVDGNNLPKVEAICNHAGTLKSLILHSSHLSVGSFLSYRTYSKEYFARLCKECTKLEQLAIALPANNVLEENFSDNFLEYLDSVIALPELITFHSTSWPEVALISTSGTPRKVPSQIYEHQVQRLADAIFERKEKHAKKNKYSSKLRVVAMGNNSKNCWPECVTGLLRPLVYVPGQLVDPFGDRLMTAVLVKISALRFVEPCSDISDHSYPDPPLPQLP